MLILNCPNEKAALDAIDALKKGKNWKELIESSEGGLQGDSGRYELSQIYIDSGRSAIPEKDTYSTIIKNTDGTASFVKYLSLYPPDQQRSFEEARGLVINDYQNVLEKKWLELLHKKYPVKINEAVVRQILN